MIELLISLLVFILIASVVLWCIRLALAAIPGGPKPIYNLAYAIVVLILLLLFLSEIGWAGAPHAWRRW
jgi:hypothetical protein